MSSGRALSTATEPTDSTFRPYQTQISNIIRVLLERYPAMGSMGNKSWLRRSFATVRDLVKQAERDAKTRGHDGLTTKEHKDLAELRQENRRLREDVEVLKQATASNNTSDIVAEVDRQLADVRAAAGELATRASLLLAGIGVAAAVIAGHGSAEPYSRIALWSLIAASAPSVITLGPSNILAGGNPDYLATLVTRDKEHSVRVMLNIKLVVLSANRNRITVMTIFFWIQSIAVTTAIIFAVISVLLSSPTPTPTRPLITPTPTFIVPTPTPTTPTPTPTPTPTSISPLT
jgi:transposase-like protein